MTKNKVEKQLLEAQRYWDKEAEAFDDEPDHGLTDPTVLAAWMGLLKSWQPVPPAKILDIGCGTGSLSLVLATLGHGVTGIDLSPRMISQATAKAARGGMAIAFEVMGAARPQFADRSFKGIVCRHLLWMLPDLPDVLQNWTDLLAPGGRLLLVEGFWHTGDGLHAEKLIAAPPSSWQNVSVVNLSAHAEFWGQEVADERYAIMAEIA
jgi:2-polyprenyl-3-methyl-5-hydroxy-6-metoxy-1,4-benzoquinol methylase